MAAAPPAAGTTPGTTHTTTTTTATMVVHSITMYVEHYAALLDDLNRKISMIFPLVSCCSCVNNPSSS